MMSTDKFPSKKPGSHYESVACFAQINFMDMAGMAKEPEQIVLTTQEVDALQERIRDFSITREDIILFGKVLLFFIWIQQKLQRCQMTISLLNRIIFGVNTERSKYSRKRQKPDRNNLSSDPVPIDKPAPANTTPAAEKPAIRGHGRIGANEYEPDEIIHVRHMTLQAGDPCPEECGGKLYRPNDDPGGIIRVKGRSCAHVVRYEFDRLRCALCGTVFTAEAPAGFSPEKYDEYFRANLVIQKYFMASPFYRQEQYQKLLGFPLPDSTQWDLVESVADCGYPVFGVLEKLAANGTHINHDDTKVKILDVMRANKLKTDGERKGTFTTCVYGHASGHKICLYYSGVRHGGENVSEVLSKRDINLPPILRMCDALSANVPAALKTVLCHCLTHGRRKFTDIEAFFPVECGHVIEQLALVYKHDAEARERNMTADERLAHHQTFSKPVMESLEKWMQAQLDERNVEPNSALGAAIRYMQKHWAELTRFLTVSGAHLDNNLVERALKLAIRTRKNAMFHKSLHGANVSALLQSLIATCELSGTHPVHYLVALQKHKPDVFKHPDLWLPWNYESTLRDLQREAA